MLQSPRHIIFQINVFVIKNGRTCEEFFDHGDSKIFVLEIDGEVVGFSTIENETKMAGFAIDPQFQSKLLGTELMKSIQKNKQTIELAVYERNQKALSFYHRNGFERISQARRNPKDPKSPNPRQYLYPPDRDKS